MVKATLLDQPQPNKFPEVHFDVSGLGTWVHFEDDEYEDWLGVFGRGDIVRERNFVVSFYTGGCALVSAWGRGYVVNVNTRTMVYRTSCDMLVGAVAIPGRDLVIACDWTNLYAYSCTAEVWGSKRIASDGIEFVDASSDTLTGRAYIWSEWQPFTLRFDSWQMTPDLDFGA
jgi:hypothetical protein